MEKINEKIEWSDVELLEDGMILTGGEEGTANEQAKALANRTTWLNENKAGEVNGKIVREGKVAIEGKDILVQSGRTVQAELDQKSDTNHTHEGGGIAPEIKVEDAGKVLAINKEGTGTEWQIVSGNPVGTIIAWAGLTPPAGYLECAGQTLKREIYKDLFQAIGTVWGSTGEENFKLPDFKSAARFLRSRGDGLEVGMVQEDAIRNIWGDMGKVCGIFAGAAINGNGAYSFIWSQNSNVMGGSNSTYPVVDVKFDSSRVIPTADENRPKNAVVMYCIKATDEYINPAQVDLAKVAEENAKKAYREDVKELAGTRLWISDPILHINETAFIAKHNLPIRNWKEIKCDFLLVCKVPEHGYSSGWSAQNVFVHQTNSFTPTPWIGGINNGEIYLKKGAGNAIYTMRTTDGAQVACNWNNWEVYFRIWY